jgi:hypothetical protein
VEWRSVRQARSLLRRNASRPRCFTSLLSAPSRRNVGAHWPTKTLACRLPPSCMAKEITIDPIASHKNVSDRSFAFDP